MLFLKTNIVILCTKGYEIMDLDEYVLFRLGGVFFNAQFFLLQFQEYHDS